MLTAGMDGAEFFPAGRGEAREKIFGAEWGRGKARVGAGQNLSISADLDHLLKKGEP